MALYERLPLSVDTQRLRQHLEEVVIPIGDPVVQGAKWGFDYFAGWSVYSGDGDYRDGWNLTTKSEEQTIPTQICTGYLKDVMDMIEDAGLQPRRARITFVKPHSSLLKHRDMLQADDRNSCCRLHIPIVTGPKVMHWTEHGEFHMDANDSVFMIRTDNLHSVVNGEDFIRYHLIMDARDTKGITTHFKYGDE